MHTNTVELTRLIAKAILQGKKKYKGINLPSGQKIGSYMQKKTYAYIKAKEVLQILSG